VRSNIKAVKDSVAFSENRNLFKQLWDMAVIALFISAPFHAAAQTSYKLDFVSDKPEAGYTQVHPDMEYNDGRGFGFEPGSSVRAGDGFVIGDSTYFFSVDVPEGNYRVQVTFGDPDAESVATVKAELRRLMIEEVKVPAGRTASRTFTANVKAPAISTGGQVRLKRQREAVQEAFNWDGKLNLQFSNSHPAGLEVDGTHHNDFGSYEIAKCVLQGIRDNNLAIAKFILNDFKGFDPSNPDKIEEFKLPRDIAVK
jgi:hypothetical protein